jgi:hypothetical protein
MPVPSGRRSPLVPLSHLPLPTALPPAHAPHLPSLQWLLQKLHLRQDALLLAAPSRHAPLLVDTALVLAGREAERLVVTRDSAEGDLKQRRVVRGGVVGWQDSVVVTAAVMGRVLVVEGLEKAERNVLPIINNLLEVRPSRFFNF